MVKVLALLIINLCSVLNSPFSALVTILDGGSSCFSDPFPSQVVT